MNGLLDVHEWNQDKDLDFWRMVVFDRKKIKDHIVQEMHSTPYSTQRRIQRAIALVRKSFYWKGLLGGVRQYVATCQVCQMEKSDYTIAKGKL